MSYIGNQPPDIGAYGVQSFDGGGTSFTLSKASTTATVLLFIDGVRQTPVDAYSVSGTTLTTTATTPSGTDNVTVQFLGDVVDFGEPSDDSVSTVKIQDDAVTAAKLANSINTEIAANTAKVTNATHTGDVTGATALTIATDAVDIAMLSATGTADATTFLRGDNAWATPSGGKILQVVYASYATQVTTGTSSVSTGTTATITPASSSNKIIVFATMNGLQKDDDNVNGRITLQVDRDGTLIHNIQANLWNYTAQTFRNGGFSILYVDSPSSTSAVVYTIKLAAANVLACYVNKDSNSGASYITLMEIA